MLSYEEAVSRCWLEVDTDAIRENYRTTRVLLGDKMQTIPVLKANAYGMGIEETAKILAEEGAKLFAVAAPAEAIQIMDLIGDAKVLTMGLCGKDSAARLIRAGQYLTLYSKDNARMLSEAAKEAGVPARVHIKIDTGLHRLGFDHETATDAIMEALGYGNIIAEGLFTHLAIHTPEMDAIQMANLERVRLELAARGVHISTVHAMDSIGMVRYAEQAKGLNAARVGAWLYGVEPSGAVNVHSLCPAKFKARISQIRKVAKGELIGYDDDHPLERDSVIATVCAGYIDGTPRRGNDWRVEIRGKQAPVIGIACMDQLMCDVTDIEDAREGDEVIFCGGIIDNELYSKMGSFNHNEAWARIGRRVPRVYIANGRVIGVRTEIGE